MVGKKLSHLSIGILALQGDVELHAQKLRALSIEPIYIRLPEQLDELQGLIIPGGESTALLKLADAVDMLPAIKRFAKRGGQIFGTCAGAILLARSVTHPAQKSLGLVDMTVQRNAYGRQINSFETNSKTRQPLSTGDLKMTFIRAPRIVSVEPHVGVLATYENEPVLVQQSNVLAATFHPELTDSQRVYKYWLSGF